jgi:hypothetical protein
MQKNYDSIFLNFSLFLNAGFTINMQNNIYFYKYKSFKTEYFIFMQYNREILKKVPIFYELSSNPID